MGTELIAVITFFVGMIVYRILSVKKPELVNKYGKYLPYAVMAAKKVEALIPSDYGEGEADSKMSKSLHKLDLYLNEYFILLEKYEGIKPEDKTQAMIDEAKKWSVKLAEEV